MLGLEAAFGNRRQQQFADEQIAFNQANRQLKQMNRRAQEQQREINELIIKTRDNNIPLKERQEIVGKTSLSEGDFPCPPNFGMFTVSNWGGFGGCGFEIFDTDGNKYWIDINPIYNLMKAVKEGPDYATKQGKLNEISEENRTPEALFAIFPDGYKTSATGDLIMPTQAAAAGGGKKKSKKSRKIRKTKRKSKRKTKTKRIKRKRTRKHA